MAEISHKLLPYLVEYFGESQIEVDEGGIFAESYLLGYDDVSWLFPKDRERQSYLDEAVNFNSAAGILSFSHKVKDIENKAYTALLLSNEDYSRALLFCLQVEDIVSGGTEVIMIKDFTLVEGI
jgi:hypothetical protein